MEEKKILLIMGLKVLLPVSGRALQNKRTGKLMAMSEFETRALSLLEALEKQLRMSSGHMSSGTPPPRGSHLEISTPDFSVADAFVWEAEPGAFMPVARVQAVAFEMLQGIDFQKELVLQNTLQFAKGFAANNVLLWGARGMGKSSLVKAVHQKIREMKDVSGEEKRDRTGGQPLKLIEINREDIATLPACLRYLQGQETRFLLYCDDLSFDAGDTTYKSLKTVLDGGLEGRPENVIFYATSNRRHLMPRDAIENETGSALHPAETVEEKISLSDRFGLWIGFHSCSQDVYLEIVTAYANMFALHTSPEALRAGAIEWAVTRGARSGRVAWQFIQDLAGKEGVPLAKVARHKKEG